MGKKRKKQDSEIKEREEQKPCKQHEIDKDKLIDELKKELDVLKNRVEELQNEVKEWKNKYLYALADYDNLRKRTRKELEEGMRYANEQFLKELLPVVDNFERALKALSDTDDLDGMKKGVEMIYNQLLEILRKEGVVSFESVGKPFDPQKHEALSVVEDDTIPEGTVVQEFEKGYIYKNRILRPARVAVSVEKKEEGKEVIENEGADNRDRSGND